MAQINALFSHDGIFSLSETFEKKYDDVVVYDFNGEIKGTVVQDIWGVFSQYDDAYLNFYFGFDDLDIADGDVNSGTLEAFAITLNEGPQTDEDDEEPDVLYGTGFEFDFAAFYQKYNGNFSSSSDYELTMALLENDDRINGSPYDDTLYGFDGDDRLIGGKGDDALTGGNGRDTLLGGDGNDILDGSKGDADKQGPGDYIRAGFGQDTIIGHEGYFDQGGEGAVISYGDISGIGGVEITVTDDATGAGTVTSRSGSSISDQFTYVRAFQGCTDDDIIRGGTSHEVFVGLEGDDTLYGGAGNDLLQYNDDQYETGGDGAVTVNFELGTAIDGFGDTDTFYSMEQVRGTEQGDTFIGSANSERMLGVGGNDTMLGAEGDDTLVGGTGDDSLVGGQGRDFLTGGDGNDILDSSDGDAESQGWGDMVRPGLGNDTIVGHQQSWELGQDGLLRSNGERYSGLDVLYDDPRTGFTSGIKAVITGESGDGYVTSIDGSDEFYDVFTYVDRIEGTQFADHITGSNQRAESYSGEAGDDTIDGGTAYDDNAKRGFDTMDYRYELSADNDLGISPQAVYVNLDEGYAIDTFGDRDTLINIEGAFGSHLDDTLLGSAAGNYLVGDDGDDVISGFAGDDLIYGNNGNDTIYDGAGNDTIDGGEGIDTAFIGSEDNLVNFADVSVVFDGDVLTISTPNHGTGTFSNVENFVFQDATYTRAELSAIYNVGERYVTDGSNDVVTGSNGNDTIASRAGDDNVSAGAGDDRIAASDGNDTVDGGSGDDMIGGGLGNDSILGGTGHDTIGSGEGNDIVDAGDGNDRVAAGRGDDNVSGGIGDDRLAGSVGEDDISGDEGEDNIGGGYNDDTIHGGTGNDTVGAGQQDDVLYGDEGDDVLNGNWGHDTIYGGDGNDTIAGGDHNDVMTGGNGADVFKFRVFNTNTEDRITDFTRGEDLLEMRGSFAGLNISSHADGLQIEKNGHVIILEDVAALSADDFNFV